MISILIFLSLCFKLQAIYVPILDTETAYPLLRNVADSATIQWSYGTIAQYQSSTAAMHISNKGIRFISQTKNLLEPRFWGSILGRATPDSTECIYGPTSLCKTKSGSSIFPTEKENALIPYEASAITDGFTRPIAQENCKRYANRFVTNTTQYSVTLCDITQKGVQIIVYNSVVYRILHEESFWFYIVISIGTILLITSIAENVTEILTQRTIKSTNAEKPTTSIPEESTEDNPVNATNKKYVNFELFVSMVVLIVVLVQQPYLTLADFIVFFFIIAYVAINLIYWFWLWNKDEGEGVDPPVNVFVATLLLTICRLYNGLENEYIFPLLFILLLRTFDKAHKLLSKTDTNKKQEQFIFKLQQPLLFFDFTLIILTHQLGFRPLFKIQNVADVYFAIMGIISYSITSKPRQQQTFISSRFPSEKLSMLKIPNYYANGPSSVQYTMAVM